MKARFIIDLDSDTWASIHSGLVAQAYLSETKQEGVIKAIESLEKQALNNELMSESDLLEWRQTIINNLAGDGN